MLFVYLKISTIPKFLLTNSDSLLIVATHLTQAFKEAAPGLLRSKPQSRRKSESAGAKVDSSLGPEVWQIEEFGTNFIGF